MNHEKEIDRLGVEYSAGIEDFKKYVVRLINMEPEEIIHVFYNDRDSDSIGSISEICWNVLADFSARGIVDTLDSYDIEQEIKGMENRIIEVTKLLKPGNALYFHDGGRVYPILVLSWTNPYFGRSFPDRVLITFYDIISEMIRSDVVVDLENISEVDFAYDNIDNLVEVFMTALKKQTKDYFEWKDREERIKHEEDTSGKHCVRLSNPGDKVEDLGILTWKEVRSLDKSIDQSKSYLDTFQIGDQDKFRVFHITPKKRCGRYKWEDIRTQVRTMGWIPEDEDDD